jgi:glycosyltransferase involved in cell wall biosynthesis
MSAGPPRFGAQAERQETVPSIDVVIDNYNYGRFLVDALESALAQTYPEVHVIAIDDGSTDESREILASYAGDLCNSPPDRDEGFRSRRFRSEREKGD